MLISFPCNYFKLQFHSNMIQYARSNDFINGNPVKPSASVWLNGDQCKPNSICCVVLLRCNPTQFLLHSTSIEMCIVTIPQDGPITLCGAYLFEYISKTSSPSLQKFCKLKQTEWLRGEVARENKCTLQITWGIENGGPNYNNASCSFSHTYMYLDIYVIFIYEYWMCSVYYTPIFIERWRYDNRE